MEGTSMKKVQRHVMADHPSLVKRALDLAWLRRKAAECHADSLTSAELTLALAEFAMRLSREFDAAVHQAFGIPEGKDFELEADPKKGLVVLVEISQDQASNFDERRFSVN